MIPPVPGDGDGADEVRHQLIKTTRRVGTLQVLLIALAALAVVISSATAVGVGIGNRRRADQTQKATAGAIQIILDYVDATMAPHRLRNEAENLCQVELIAGDPPLIRKGLEPSLAFYRECVTRRAGGTPAPPVPELKKGP